MLAITGGTGSYRQAHGQMLLHASGNPVGSEYDFITQLGAETRQRVQAGGGSVRSFLFFVWSLWRTSQERQATQVNK